MYVNLGMCQAVQESRATFKPLPASSQISSSEGLHVNQRTKPKKPKQKRQDDPQIPRQICVSSKRKNSKPDTKKGPEPKQHPLTRFAKGHSGLTTVSASKTCENELSTTTFKHTRRPSPEAYPLKRRCAKAVHNKSRAANYASLVVISEM